MQGQCKPNAIEFTRIAEAQPVLAILLQKYSPPAKRMFHWREKMFQIWDFFYFCCNTCRYSLHVMPYALRKRRESVVRLGMPESSPMRLMDSSVVFRR